MINNQNENENRKCIFPFTHHEISYEKCIKEGNSFWCEAEKDSQGSQQNQNWGVCNDKCEKLRGDWKCYECLFKSFYNIRFPSRQSKLSLSHILF